MPMPMSPSAGAPGANSSGRPSRQTLPPLMACGSGAVTRPFSASTCLPIKFAQKVRERIQTRRIISFQGARHNHKDCGAQLELVIREWSIPSLWESHKPIQGVGGGNVVDVEITGRQETITGPLIRCCLRDINEADIECVISAS